MEHLWHRDTSRERKLGANWTPAGRRKVIHWGTLRQREGMIHRGSQKEEKWRWRESRRVRIRYREGPPNAESTRFHVFWRGPGVACGSIACDWHLFAALRGDVREFGAEMSLDAWH